MHTTQAISRRSGATRGRTLSLRTAACLAAVLGALAPVLFAAMRGPLKDDVAWLLYLAEQWLDGRRLYVDLLEINPPLVIWISALPVALARALGLPALPVAPPFFAALVLGCAWWAASILRRRGVCRDRVAPFSVLGAVLLLLPANDFGQREHLLAAAAMPYLALRTGDRRRDAPAGADRAEALAAGVLVGLCCALKPWFAAAFALAEAFAVAGGARPLWEAALGAAAAGLAFIAAVAALHPDYIDGVVPLARALYGVRDPVAADLFRESAGLLFGGAAAGALWAAHRRRMADGHAMGTLLAFAAGATLAYLLQGKGWFYHRIPATAAVVLALLVWAANPRLGPVRRRGAAFALAVAALVALAKPSAILLARWDRVAMAPDRGLDARLVGLIRAERARSYVAFSRSLDLGFPVVNETGVAFASRFASTWALYGAYWRAADDPGSAAGVPAVARWMAEDFLAVCPDLVVVDDGDGLDYARLLGAADARFAAAWSAYRQVTAFDDLRVFRGPRRDVAPASPTPDQDPRPPRQAAGLGGDPRRSEAEPAPSCAGPGAASEGG